jgi:hypothetical protein
MANEPEKKEEDLGDFPDAESKKIAEEMVAEKATKEKEKGEPETPEKPEPKKPDDSEEDSEEEADKEKDGKKGDDGDEDKDEPEPKKKEGRIPKTMLLYEHMHAKEGWQKKEKALLAEIEQLKQNKPDQTKTETASDIKAIAEEFGFEPAMIEKLVNVIGAKTTLPAEIKEKLEAFESEKKEQVQEQLFTKHFSKEVLPILTKDGIDEKGTDKIKKLIHELAFTEKYATYDLDDIYIMAKQKGMIENLGVFKGRKTAEGGRGGIGAGGGGGSEKKSFAEMSEKEFEEFSDDAGKNTSNLTIVNPDGSIG